MPTPNIKVLIAEDEKPMAKALELALTKAGFTAKSVFDGQQAMDELVNDYDLLLLDLIMPVADGFEVLAYVKEKKPQLKVIITSNLSQPEDIAKAKEMGALDYLVKSNVSLAQIVDKVKQHTGLK